MFGSPFLCEELFNLIKRSKITEAYTFVINNENGISAEFGTCSESGKVYPGRGHEGPEGV